LKKHLLQNKFNFVFIIAAAFILGCGKKQNQTDFLARVEDSYLTKEDIASELDTSRLNESRKNEFVRNWIEREILYKQAIDEDITDEDEFNRIIENSKNIHQG